MMKHRILAVCLTVMLVCLAPAALAEGDAFDAAFAEGALIIRSNPWPHEGEQLISLSPDLSKALVMVGNQLMIRSGDQLIGITWDEQDPIWRREPTRFALEILQNDYLMMEPDSIAWAPDSSAFVPTSLVQNLMLSRYSNLIYVNAHTGEARVITDFGSSFRDDVNVATLMRAGFTPDGVVYYVQYAGEMLSEPLMRLFGYRFNSLWSYNPADEDPKLVIILPALQDFPSLNFLPDGSILLPNDYIQANEVKYAATRLNKAGALTRVTQIPGYSVEYLQSVPLDALMVSAQSGLGFARGNLQTTEGSAPLFHRIAVQDDRVTGFHEVLRIASPDAASAELVPIEGTFIQETRAQDMEALKRRVFDPATDKAQLVDISLSPSGRYAFLIVRNYESGLRNRPCIMDLETLALCWPSIDLSEQSPFTQTDFMQYTQWVRWLKDDTLLVARGNAYERYQLLYKQPRTDGASE